MAAGDYSKTTYVNGGAPAISASNLNNIEDKVDELDTIVGTLVGSVTMYAGSSAPAGWLLCNGQAVSRTTYSALFSAIGTTWGVGNGSTTFNVPDMRESSPYGAGTYAAVTGTTHGPVTTHDALALGTSAEDRLETHIHTVKGALEGALGSATRTVGGAGDNNGFTEAPSTGRIGSTTRGKIIGINFIIKY